MSHTNRIRPLFESTEISRESPLVGGGLRTSRSACEGEIENFPTTQSLTFLNPDEAYEAMRRAVEATHAEESHQSLADEVSEIKERLQYLESLASTWQDHATYFEVRDAIDNVNSITEEVFGLPFECVEHEDCEIAGDRLFEIQIHCPGDIESILRKHDEWHSRVACLPLKMRRLFHLSVDPVD